MPLGFLKVTAPPALDCGAGGAPGVGAASGRFDRRVLRQARRGEEDAEKRRPGDPDRDSEQRQAQARPESVFSKPAHAAPLPGSRAHLPRIRASGRRGSNSPNRPARPAGKPPPVRLIRGFQAPDIRRRGADRGRCPGRRADDDEDRDRQPGGDDGADPHGRRRRGGHRARRGAARRGRRGAEDDRQGVADPGDRRHPLQPHPGAEGDRRRRPLHPPQPGQHRRPRESRRGRGEGDRGGRADADRRQLGLAAQAPARARARARRSRRWSPPRSSSSS